MSSITLGQVLELVEQFSPEDQRKLAARLPAADVSTPPEQPEREDPATFLARITAEQEARRQAGISPGEPLMGRFGPPRHDISEEELRATPHGARFPAVAGAAPVGARCLRHPGRRPAVALPARRLAWRP